MNIYNSLIAATIATLATVPSISGFTPPATFAVRSHDAAAFRVDSIGDFGVAIGGGVHQHSNRGSVKPEASMMDAEMDLGIEAIIPCEVANSIGIVSLCFEAAGLGGGGAKKVATKVYTKLPAQSKTYLGRILAEMTVDNFTDKAWEILNLIYNELTWNALTDAFGELGLWDGIVFGLNFAAIFATGGTAFILRITLLANSFITLISDIVECERNPTNPTLALP